MSIYERTKEIGVIKVLGCSLKNIRQMFLLEAAFIGLMGGAAGCVLSFAVSAVINALTRQRTSWGGGGISFIPPWLVLAAVDFPCWWGWEQAMPRPAGHEAEPAGGHTERVRQKEDWSLGDQSSSITWISR